MTIEHQDFTIRFRYDEPSNSFAMFAAGKYLGTVMQGDTLMELIKYGCTYGYNALISKMELNAPEGSAHSRDLEAEALAIKLHLNAKPVRKYDHRGRAIKISLADIEDLLDESDFELGGAQI